MNGISRKTLEMFNLRQAYKNPSTDDTVVGFFVCLFVFVNEHTIAGEDDQKFEVQHLRHS